MKKVSWKLGLLYFLLMTLLCRLGFWQIERAEQKKQILIQQQSALTADGLDLNANLVIDKYTVRYRPVTVRGHYDTAHQLLIDNQVVEGKVGYNVLTPFWIAQQNQYVLVNRGWIAAPSQRNQLPNVAIQADIQQINGRINHFPSVGYKLLGAEMPTGTWPAVVQVVDSQVLSVKLGYQLLDYQLELDAGSEEGYLRDWKITTVIPPEKHIAYAVQWFGLALTLTSLFIWIIIRKRSEHTA